MADLDDLDYQSITDMGNGEAIELLRQIRLSRRIPVKKVYKTKKVSKSGVPKVDKNQAEELLKILTGR